MRPGHGFRGGRGAALGLAWGGGPFRDSAIHREKDRQTLSA